MVTAILPKLYSPRWTAWWEMASSRSYNTFIPVKQYLYASLEDKFSSSLDILDVMRSIRCIEHKGKAKMITPFVGAQVDICEAFSIDIPQGCALLYLSKQVKEKRRGRPINQKVENLEH